MIKVLLGFFFVSFCFCSLNKWSIDKLFGYLEEQILNKKIMSKYILISPENILKEEEYEIISKIQKQIKDKCKDYNFDDNIKNELLEKDDYENIIKKIFEFNIQESKSKKDYGRYKDNSYKMNQIEFMIDSIFDDDIKRVIYGDLDIDLIYNFYSTQLI